MFWLVDISSNIQNWVHYKWYCHMCSIVATSNTGGYGSIDLPSASQAGWTWLVGSAWQLVSRRWFDKKERVNRRSGVLIPHSTRLSAFGGIDGAGRVTTCGTTEWLSVRRLATSFELQGLPLITSATPKFVSEDVAWCWAKELGAFEKFGYKMVYLKIEHLELFISRLSHH